MAHPSLAKQSGSSRTFLDQPLVVEIGSRIAVTATGSLLAQLGAEVVVLEPSEASSRGKWLHRAPAMAGKASVCLEAARASGSLDELLNKADVILISTDVDPEQLHMWQQPRSATVICDLTAFGHSGPLAGQPLSEGHVEALSGIVAATGRPDETPSVLGTSLLDMHAAVYAAGAIVAALRSRRLHGLGDRIEVALFDVGTCALINHLPLFLLGRPTLRSGNRHPLYGPWGTYAAMDGTFLMCAVTDRHWQEICRVIGRPELAADPRFSSSTGRLDNFPELDAVVQAWVAQNTMSECEEAMQRIGIPCGKIVTIDAIPDEPNVRHRNSVRKVLDPVSGADILLPASPFRGDLISGLSPVAIPMPGQDTGAVIARLRDRKKNTSTDAEAGQKALPFSGVRLVEIGQYTVGPLASRIMGALGADVIKVEPPRGDVLRAATPLRADGQAYIFAISNTDKRGIVLDLTVAEDRAKLWALLETADILLENLKPGSLAKLGFDRRSLREKAPHLIYCSINGFGVDSVYPGRPALDTVIQAMSGLMDLTRPHGEPTKAGISSSDNFGGQFGFLGVAAALEFRDRTGLACHLDLSMQEGTIWSTQFEWGAHRSERPYILTASDGYVAVEGERAHLSQSWGVAEEELDRIAAGLQRNELLAKLPESVKGQPVLTAEEVFEHPQLKERGILVDCPTLEGDSWTVFSQPFRFSRTPTPVRLVLGRLGGSNPEIEAELLSTSSG